MIKLLAVVAGLLCLAAPVVAYGAYPPFDLLTWAIASVLTLLMLIAAGICFAVALA